MVFNLCVLIDSLRKIQGVPALPSPIPFGCSAAAPDVVEHVRWADVYTVTPRF